MSDHPRRAAVLSLLAVLLAGAARADSSPVTVRDAWMRPTSAGAAGAGYLTIVNHGRFADTLAAIASPDAASATLHESRMLGGVMTMRPLPALAIPSGGSVALKPGGLHVMLRGVNRTLKVGDRATLILTFAKAGRVKVVLTVRAGAAVDSMAGMKM